MAQKVKNIKKKGKKYKGSIQIANEVAILAQVARSGASQHAKLSDGKLLAARRVSEHQFIVLICMHLASVADAAVYPWLQASAYRQTNPTTYCFRLPSAFSGSDIKRCSDVGDRTFRASWLGYM